MTSRLVVIGGGFAGAYVAKKLEQEFETTLIDTKDYFEFTPSVLRTIIEPGYTKRIRVLHEDYLQRARFIRGYVEGITPGQPGSLKVEGRTLPFDYLVIASGLRYATPFRQDNIIAADRARELRNHADTLKEARSVLIIGGGPVGVELAAEISYAYPQKQITIVHSREQLLQQAPEKVRHAVERLFVRRNIHLFLNERVKENKGKVCITERGTRLEADMIFLCTGNTPNLEFLRKCLPGAVKQHGIGVNPNLQVRGYPNIFAAGDIADINEEKLAQNAEKHGELIVENLRRSLHNDPLQQYVPQERVMLISLGKRNGVLIYKGFSLHGIIPAALKHYVERRTMRRYRSRS